MTKLNDLLKEAGEFCDGVDEGEEPVDLIRRLMGALIVTDCQKLIEQRLARQCFQALKATSQTRDMQCDALISYLVQYPEA